MSFIKYFKYSVIFVLLPFILLFTGCTKEPVIEPVPELTSVPDDMDSQIKDFIWEAMNSWYLYQAEEPDLRDSRDDDINGYLSFLRSYPTPEALFDALIYKPNIKDRFSFIVDDYEELQNQLQGVSKSFGYDYRLVRTSGSSNDLIGYVRYVLPGSPADSAGIRRGDLFGKIDGKQLTTTNYTNLLFDQTNYDLGLVSFDDGRFVPNGTLYMEAEVIRENPIYESKVLETGGQNIGYLAYNGFNHLYHQELNQVFGEFKRKGVGELVLDLRYNPGGSVVTAATLASMIYTNDTGKRFITFDYNDKHNDQDRPMNFMDQVYLFNEDFEITGTEPLNTLGLDRLFVLTSSGTASASEAIINGLEPYIDVIVIGEATVGKNVGSLTLYDAPSSDYSDKSAANPIHTYALQPLTTKIVNSTGFGEYEDGLKPDIELSEMDYLTNLKPLGSAEEPLLNAALEYVSPTRSGMRSPATFDGSQVIPGPERKSQNPFYQAMTLNGVTGNR